MSYLLNDRQHLRRALFHAVGASETDDELTEHDSETLEQANYYLMHGIWRAQRWMIDKGYSGWRARELYGTGGVAWEGSDSDVAGRYAALPEDFLRANGDQHRSALRDAGNPTRRWGTLLLDDELLGDRRGDYYAVRGTGSHDGYLHLASGANPPASMVLDYYAKHVTLTADTGEGGTVDFPEECAPLCVAMAADMAADDSWLPGGNNQQATIARMVEKAQKQVVQFLRTNRGPRVLQARPAHFGRWL